MDAIKSLGKPINGPFEALCFKTPKGQPKLRPKIKTCYLRLSEKLDPVDVVEKINYYYYKINSRLRASIPDNVPDVSMPKILLCLTPRKNSPLHFELLPKSFCSLIFLCSWCTKFTRAFNIVFGRKIYIVSVPRYYVL